MPGDRGARVALAPLSTTAETREWAVTADGTVVGSITAARAGDVARLTVAVDAGDEQRDVVRQAIGRLIGSPPFPDSAVLSMVAADAALLRELGFEPSEDGTWTRAVGRPPRTGPERFLDRSGRIVRFPVRTGDLRELLAAVVPRVLMPGEVLSERELNDRIRLVADDVALVRRHLVDHGLVERTRSGSEYALVGPVDNF